MSKISYVSGNLHRISDQLSEASAKKTSLPGEEAEVPLPESAEKVPPAPPQEEVRPDYAKLHQHLKPRHEELIRLKRDIHARITRNRALYLAESETLHLRKTQLDGAVAGLDAIREKLDAREIPDFADPEFKTKLADALRAFENARLEEIRIGAKMEGSRSAAREDGGNRGNAPGLPLASLTGGELFKKGFAFFLPLILALLFSALLLAAAFFAAWKIAF